MKFNFLSADKYYKMNDVELESEASKWKIRGYGDTNGNVHRQIIIDALIKKDELNTSGLTIFMLGISAIISVVSAIILIVYTVETYKIRKNAEEQLIMGIRPYIAFLADPIPYTLVNKSNNIAQNVFQISKLNGQYFISDEGSMGGLAPNGQIHFDKNKNTLITNDELRRRIPSISKLINYLDKKQITCIVAIYDDLFGNKIFSVFYGSGDVFGTASETKYINDL